MNELERLVRETQREHRIPALSVALRRNDRELWTFQVGGEAVTADSRFRIGSITKTFTAVLVLQARDAGLLGLDEPIAKYLELPAHGDLTFRRLLSHTAGVQREPFGDLWDTLAAPDLSSLLTDLTRAEAVHPPSRRFHYSNLGFALLGHAAARAFGGQWWPLVRERILQPLGLTAVTFDRPAHAVVGYLVDAYSDVAWPEPVLDTGAVAPAAQLWSNAADMALWAAFLADPASVPGADAVLKAETLEEMRWPHTTRHESVWYSSMGLGPMLYPQTDHSLHIGHNGAMPGFLAAAFGRRGGAGNPGGLAVGVLSASGTATAAIDLCHRLLGEALTADPAEIAPWVPGEAPPEELRGLLGHWWGEGFEYVFRWRDGALTASGVDDPAWLEPATFASVPGETGVYRTISGREVGELLRVTRAEDGTPIRLHWATYRFTRAQETFDGTNRA
jgi:CubicO group peptidase (beta-lactamase class C family)